MKDEILAESLKENFSQQENPLLDAAITGSSTDLKQFKIAQADLHPLKGLENVLPGIQLLYSSDGQAGATADPPAKPSLDEPGEVKARVSANPAIGLPMDLIEYEDGTRRQVFPDGTIFEMRESGMWIHVRPNASVRAGYGDNGLELKFKPSHLEKEVAGINIGSNFDVTYTYKDGTTEQQSREGDLSVQFTDGSSYSNFADGRSSITVDNGERRYYDAHGKITADWQNLPDGSQICRNGDGKIIIVNSPDMRRRDFTYGPDGQLDEVVGRSGTWKRAVGPDGKSTWVNLSTKPHPTSWHGEMRVNDHGNLRYTPHDPKAQAWIFTPGGSDVPVRHRT